MWERKNICFDSFYISVKTVKHGCTPRDIHRHFLKKIKILSGHNEFILTCVFVYSNSVCYQWCQLSLNMHKHKIDLIFEQLNLMNGFRRSTSHMDYFYDAFKGNYSPKNETLLKMCSPSGHQRCRWVSSQEQIWRNLVLHHFLTNGSSAVNGCRQNEIE